MSASFPSFYCTKAKQSFLNAYGDDPNVVSAEVDEPYIRVTLRNLNEGVFPLTIDGVPFAYVENLEEAV